VLTPPNRPSAQEQSYTAYCRAQQKDTRIRLLNLHCHDEHGQQDDTD
jgi:hypothetical protein